LKENIRKPTLDDIAFEGRNKNYGAHYIRKTYPVRLRYSFLFTLSALAILLVFIDQASRNRSKEYYYNPFLDAQVVGVNLSNNPYPAVAIQQIKGSSSSATNEAPLIVDDNQLSADLQKNKNAQGGANDSSGMDGKGNNGQGTGNIDEAGGRIEGEVFGSAEINPQFPGGMKAMQEFIKENLRYPDVARSLSISGSIHVFMVVLSDGTLRDIKVIKGLQPDLDKEAIRVVKSMPLWKPGVRGGVPVNVRCVIPITVSPLK
jgi:periplasmic protein TonB